MITVKLNKIIFFTVDWCSITAAGNSSGRQAPGEVSLQATSLEVLARKEKVKLQRKHIFFLFIIFFGLPCRKYPSVFSLHHNSLLGAGTPSVLAIITLSHLSPFMPSNLCTFKITSKQMRTRRDSTFAGVPISPVQFSTTF